MSALNLGMQSDVGPTLQECFSTAQLRVSDQLHWYAVYTRSRHEKRVQQQLDGSVPECFLPLYQVVRNWKNGKAVVACPLFPGYLFARISYADRKRVLTTPGVVGLVGTRCGPIAIPDEELNALRDCFERQIRLEPHPYLTVGRRVQVKNGPFAGMEGILLRKKGKWRLIVSIDLISRSVAVEIDVSDAAPVANRRSLVDVALPVQQHHVALPVQSAQSF